MSVRNFLTPKEFVVTVRFGSEHVRNLSSPSIECYAGPWATIDNTVCRAVYLFMHSVMAVCITITNIVFSF